MSDIENNEKPIRQAFDAGDMDRAATLIIERYGREVLGFLVVRTRDEAAASEVFSTFSEQMWLGLPKFEWRSSVRTWVYIIAKRASGHHFRKHPRAKNLPLSQAGSLSRAVEQVRTATAAYLRTEVKDRFRELREQMPQEDQQLLVLRVDRKIPWTDLAQIMAADSDVTLSDEDLSKEAARLRKRFQLAKEKLRSMAQAEGLLDQNKP